MSKHVRWLMDELQVWTNSGLISREQADRIRQTYPEPKGGLPWGTIIFSGLGAVILGLGVILLCAYNWKAMPKEAKLALLFIPLAGAHVSGIRLFQCQDWRRQLGEALIVLGTMLFGAGIWLVAQIYNIDEHFPNGFLIWGLGALVMTWALSSRAHGILSVVVLVTWSCTEAWGFDAPRHWGPWLILFGVGVFALGQRSRLLLVFSLAGFVLSLIASTTALKAGLVVPVLLNFSAVFIALALLRPRHAWFAESAGIWATFGWAGFLTCAYLLSFHGIVEDLLGWHRGDETPRQFTVLAYAWVSLTLALLAWSAVARPWLSGPKRARQRAVVSVEDWLVPLTAGFSIVFTMTPLVDQQWIVAGVFNLVCLALAAQWMARGCQRAQLRPTILGSLLLAWLAAGRYFDLFDSLAWRGFVFVVVGGLLFTEGIFYSRARRRLREEGAV